METIHIRIKEGVTLHCIPSDKFTSDSLSVHFIVPLREETATAYSLLPRVLKRGSLDYPTQELINKRLEELYAASVTMVVSKLCEREDLFVSVNMLDNRFSAQTSPQGRLRLPSRSFFLRFWKTAAFLPISYLAKKDCSRTAFAPRSITKAATPRFAPARSCARTSPTAFLSEVRRRK